MRQRPTSRPFGLRDVMIVGLTLATAIIHVVLAIGTDDVTTKVMFSLNGLGYVGLVAALYLPQLRARRRLIRWALIAFTGVTVLGWVAIGDRIPIGFVDKAIEVVLLALLILDARDEG